MKNSTIENVVLFLLVFNFPSEIISVVDTASVNSSLFYSNTTNFSKYVEYCAPIQQWRDSRPVKIDKLYWTSSLFGWFLTERLRRKDELIKEALQEKQKLVADILHVPKEEFETISDIAGEPMYDKEASEVVLAAVNQGISHELWLCNVFVYINGKCFDFDEIQASAVEFQTTQLKVSQTKLQSCWTDWRGARGPQSVVVYEGKKTRFLYDYYFTKRQLQTAVLPIFDEIRVANLMYFPRPSHKLMCPYVRNLR